MFEMTKIAVIGGGAAGLMAAGTAVSLGADVTIFEHMQYVGRKIGITGKGRCNLTNACTLQEFMENVPRNPRFLYAALSALSPSDTMQLFESLGVKLKVERALTGQVFNHKLSDASERVVLGNCAKTFFVSKKHENRSGREAEKLLHTVNVLERDRIVASFVGE